MTHKPCPLQASGSSLEKSKNRLTIEFSSRVSENETSHSIFVIATIACGKY